MASLRWRNLTVLLALAAVLLLAPAANADTLFSGYLTSNPGDHFGITASDGWGIDPWFKVAWNITDPDPTDGLLHYQYLITNAAGGALSKSLSHFILQVSLGATAADFLNANPAYASGDPQIYTSSSEGQSNPNMPNPIFGLKFSASGATATIDFDSTRMPMWGNFYAKDGVDNLGGGVKLPVTAWNTGLSGGGAYIAVPDTGVPVVPVPPTVLLLGSGLLGLGLISIRKRQKGS